LPNTLGNGRYSTEKCSSIAEYDSIQRVPLQWDERVVINEISRLELFENNIAVYEKNAKDGYLFSLNGYFLGTMSDSSSNQMRSQPNALTADILKETICDSPEILDSLTGCPLHLMTQKQDYALGYLETDILLSEAEKNRNNQYLNKLSAEVTNFDNPVIYIFRKK